MCVVDRSETSCQLTSSSPNIVFVSVLGFLNDELSVEQDEAAHEQQPQIHVSLSAERTIRTEETERLGTMTDQQSGTLNRTTDPKKTLTSDRRSSRERPDIRVPEENNDSALFCIHLCSVGFQRDDAALTSEEKVAPAFGVKCAESEADEDHRGSHEGCHDDAEETHRNHHTTAPLS